MIITRFRQPFLRPHRIARSELQSRLSGILEVPFSLILAPAGFGKTTLLGDWLQAQEGCRVFLALEDGDNDLIRFFRYLVGSFAKERPAWGQNLAEILKTPHVLSKERFLALLLNELAELNERFLLVLDDYHLLHAEAIHEAIRFLMDRWPQNGHLVISSRCEPSLPFARYRAKGYVFSLQAKDLRFTAEETSLFFTKTMRLPLSLEEQLLLWRMSEGWVGGLQLAAISFQRVSDTEKRSALAFQTARPFASFFREEILRPLSSEMRLFLIQTSILPCLSPSLCEAVTGLRESAAYLRWLEQNHLFIEPLEPSGSWFRYHALFSATLQEILLEDFEAEKRSKLHEAASLWFLREQMFDEALTHAHQAGDQETFFALLEEVGWIFLERGEYAVLRQWLERIPASVRRRHLQLELHDIFLSCFLGVWEEEMGSRLEALEVSLLEAASSLEGAAPSFLREKQAQIASVRALWAWGMGDIERSLRYSQEALRDLPEGRPFLRTFVALNQIYLLFDQRGDLNEARTLLEHLKLKLSPTSRSLLLDIYLYGGKAFFSYEMGHLSDAWEFCEEAFAFLQLKKEAPLHALPPHTALLFCIQGAVLRERGQLREALALAEKACLLAQRGADWSITASCFAIFGCVLTSLGSYSEALSWLDRACLTSSSQGPQDLYWLCGIRARMWAIAGQKDRLSAWFASEGFTASLPIPLGKEHGYLCYLRSLIREGHTSPVFEPLEEIQTQAKRTSRWWRFFEASLLSCLALWQEGRSSEAFCLLREVLRLASQSGFFRSLVEEGENFVSLLRAWKDSPLGPHDDLALCRFVDRLLEASSSPPAFEPQTPLASVAPPLSPSSSVASNPFAPLSPPLSPLPLPASSSQPPRRPAFPSPSSTIGGLPTSILVAEASFSPPLTPLSTALASPSPSSDPASASYPLSRRELEVLALVAQGQPNKLIAKQLFISLETVKQHLKNIFGKLAVSNRTQAVAEARRLGITL